MKKISKIVSALLLLYVTYYAGFTLIALKSRTYPAANFSYDVAAMREASDEDIYTAIIDEPTVGLDLRLELIMAAQNEIRLTSLIFKSDETGSLIYGALLKRASENVKVTIITDALNTKKDHVFKAVASHPNIDYYLFEPFDLLRPQTLQNVMHDKILTIDTHYGLLSGRNLSNKFLQKTDRLFSLDRDILLYNNEEPLSVVNDMAAYVDEVRASPYVQKVDYKQKGDVWTELIANFNAYYTSDFTAFPFATSMRVDNATFVRSPLNRGNKEPVLANVFTALAKDADDIIIQSPYFTSSRMMDDLGLFAAGKNYTLITNNPHDNPNYPATTNYILNRKRLARAHTLYEFQGPYPLHGKAALIDDDIALVGSQNFDHRSMYLSTESYIVVCGSAFNHALRGSLDALSAQSLVVCTNGKYLEKEGVTPVKARPLKQVLLSLLSVLTYPFRELL